MLHLASETEKALQRENAEKDRCIGNISAVQDSDRALDLSAARENALLVSRAELLYSSWNTLRNTSSFFFRAIRNTHTLNSKSNYKTTSKKTCLPPLMRTQSSQTNEKN